MKLKISHLCSVVILVILMVTGCDRTVTPQRYVHKAIAIMDKTALFAEGPLWDEVQKRALSYTPETMDEAYDIVREALETAGGKHSFLMEGSEAQYNDTTQWEMPVIEITGDSILVVTVPHFAGNETLAKQYAQTLQDGISSDARDVILDLRGNTGGNMYPMIAGVNALLPDGIVLKFRQRNGRESNLTAEYIAKVQGVERNATIFPTAGYASGNRTFDMGDGSKLVVTSSCDVARTGEVFCDDPICPDCLTDMPMDAALEWLRAASYYITI